MPPAPQPTDPDRRDFLKKACCVAIGGALGAVPAAAGAAYYLDPLLRNVPGSEAAKDGIRVTSLEALPADNVPRKFYVYATRIDAWTKEVGAIGAVYIQRSKDNQFTAFNAMCPHAGGSVVYEPANACYECPIHHSTFKLDGSILAPSSPAPRGLDKLVCFVSPENPTDVMVKFQNFKTGTADEIPTS